MDIALVGRDLMRQLALATITAYQRYLSPYKGFCCAYRIHTGRASCSAIGYRVIRRYGVFAGVALLRRRTYLCGVAHRRYSPACQRPHRAQRGDCDLGCDLPCNFNVDLPSSKTCSSLSDFSSCCDCGGCDGSDKKRKSRSPEEYICIPPNTRLKMGAAQ